MDKTYALFVLQYDIEFGYKFDALQVLFFVLILARAMIQLEFIVLSHT